MTIKRTLSPSIAGNTKLHMELTYDENITYFKRNYPDPLISLTGVCFSDTNWRKNKEILSEKTGLFSRAPDTKASCFVLLVTAKGLVFTDSEKLSLRGCFHY